MGMTQQGWEKEIKKLSDEELSAKYHALEELLTWKKFFEHYSWTGLDVMRSLLHIEMQRREKSE